MKSFLLIALALSAAVAMAGCDGSSDSSDPSQLSPHAGKTYKVALTTATPKATTSIPKVLYFDMDDDGDEADILVLYEDNSFKEYDDVKAVSAPDGGLSFTVNSELSISTNAEFTSVGGTVSSHNITGAATAEAGLKPTSSTLEARVRFLKDHAGKEYLGKSENGYTEFAISFGSDSLSFGMDSNKLLSTSFETTGSIDYSGIKDAGSLNKGYDSIRWDDDNEEFDLMSDNGNKYEGEFIDENVIKIDGPDGPHGKDLDYFLVKVK